MLFSLSADIIKTNARHMSRHPLPEKLAPVRGIKTRRHNADSLKNTQLPGRGFKKPMINAINAPRRPQKQVRLRTKSKFIKIPMHIKRYVSRALL